MKFFLGFCPDEEANHSIRKVVSELGKVFDDFQISVRWVNPDNYHLEIISLGDELPFFKILWLKYRLKNFRVKPFKVVLNNACIGINGKYKELVYLNVKSGGEEMRDLLFNLRKLLGLKDQGNFIPHLVLGRISEDMGDQEYSNISKDLYRVGKELEIGKIQFYVNDVKLIKHSPVGFEILLELNQNQSSK